MCGSHKVPLGKGLGFSVQSELRPEFSLGARARQSGAHVGNRLAMLHRTIAADIYCALHHIPRYEDEDPVIP